MPGRFQARKYRFTKDADTKWLLGSNMSLGTLDVAREFRKSNSAPDLYTITWKNEVDINVRASSDQNSCEITASALLSTGLFLLTDFENCSVKLVDVTTHTVTSRIELPGEPWDVCVLPDDQAAVTLPDKSMIQLLSTQGGQLSFEKEIKVSSGCRGIAYCNNRLYVSYVYKPSIEVMTLGGHIISTFQTDDGRPLFQNPQYLTVSATTPPTIYVSDYNAHAVLQLSLDGKILREYRNEKVRNPASIVEVGLGQLLVCWKGSHTVMLLTARDGNLREILGHTDGLASPYSVSFCPHTHTIVVGMYENDSLKVFNAI
ncbi:uncharacterized protein LOC128244326 [Mya arenaria]|uniref:uncharacterized protein LOC128244326 n=1 Tax=Mya arenaria TaxID=6604 RepID=UPI0022E5A868|nr:uncharacterized protein LOC128244326 [Mya arenaria]